MRRLALLVFGLGLGACDSEFPAAPADAGDVDARARTQPCAQGESVCVDGKLRTCLEDETGWLEQACGEGTLCVEGACAERICAAGERACAEGGVHVCDADGMTWGPVQPCAEDDTCLQGACVPRQCAPGERACGDGVILECAPDGISWTRTPCGADEICVDGACGPPAGDCEAGRTLCADAEVFHCEGGRWRGTPCAEGQACFAGRCVDCVRDADCAEATCLDGACVAPPLAILTEDLPAGQVARPYAAQLEGAHGVPPYAWSVVEGGLPQGLALDPAEGTITGQPQAEGGSVFTVELTDAEQVAARRDLGITILPPGLVVATDRLPDAEEGEDYATALEALGGEGPYGWFLVEGALPEGLVLTADGRISGVPTEIGVFPLRIRVVDAATPPDFAEAELSLTVDVAPLVIVGDQVIDLFITRVVTLPTLTIIPGIPAIYDTRLQARGGLRPHAWAEEDIPAAARPILPQAGIPEGLVLEEDGRLHGIVEDPDSALVVEIPFTGIRLTGFFFFAEVRDSQEVPDTASAIFLLPTLPLGM